MIKYYDLGSDKRLNDIVVAGSHDAGITGGAGNVQTQDLDILGQAVAGVRVYDIRIAATKGTEPVLKTYHGAKVDPSKKSFRGAYGETLSQILADARNFVTWGAYQSEFLILKFDKCSRWDLIADACVNILGDSIYTGTGNLNTKTLRDVAGKVIVLFTSSGLKEVRKSHPVGGGILGIKNINSEGAVYEDDYDGMQYFGKGGTSVAKPTGKIAQNIAKQSKLMHKGSSGNPDVMGMMYWTSTGVFESIRDRNDTMWTGTNVAALKRMWKNGLAESIESRIANHVDPTSHASGGILKAFMPNIVMIDFADPTKCQTIYDLNFVAAIALTNASQQLDAEVEQLQANYAKLQKRKGN